jgi:phosphatidate cytidylyltransferase
MLAALYPLGLFWGLRHRVYRPQITDAVLLAIPPILFALLTFRAAWTGSALGRLRRYNGLIGAVYIGLLLGSFVLLRDLGPRTRVAPFGTADRGAWLMLLVALCVWAEDTAAYFAGRSLGRHKLAPTLSPGKTVEGALGGLFGALIVGVSFGRWFGIPLQIGLVFGALAGTFGPLGDLWESALKRELGIKDFGAVMPGHGGALDRFDSLLFVAPLAYLYLRCIAG